MASLAIEPLPDTFVMEDVATRRTLEVILGSEHLQTGGAVDSHTSLHGGSEQAGERPILCTTHCMAAVQVF